MNNCVIIIFGVTGDLAKRKLIPALYALVAANKYEKLVIVGVAIDNTTIEDVLEQSRPFVKDVNERVWNQLIQNAFYQKLDFTVEHDFKTLQDRVSELEERYSFAGSRLAYFASPPNYFCMLTRYCATSGLIKKVAKDEPFFNKIVYEKPFGNSLESAREINACIAKFFYEDQIYRIDHYLTKEVVGNIVLVRFTNAIFEPIWDYRFIDQVTIILDEEICMEGRGIYYDTYGAMRDVVQNHMLELLSLVAMDTPQLLTGEYIRDERVRVLQHVSFVDGILGQYEGYKKEKGVSCDSTTETFSSLIFNVNNERWAGVPFYLKTGKCLGEKMTEIQIRFTDVQCLLLQGCPGDSNYLTINVYPTGAFSLSLNAKKPGMLNEIIPVDMDFCHSCQFGPSAPESYEVLFEEILKGEQSISVRFDEIEYLWNIIDMVYKKDLLLYPYQKGSDGPSQVKEFEKKHKLRIR